MPLGDLDDKFHAAVHGCVCVNLMARRVLLY